MPSRRPRGRRSRRRAKAETQEPAAPTPAPAVIRATPIVTPKLVRSEEDGYFRRVEELR